MTDTEITCVLNPISEEGTFDVIVSGNEQTSTAGQIDVITPFEANDVNPKLGIDILGGDTLTIIGRGFPSLIADIEVVLGNVG